MSKRKRTTITTSNETDGSSSSTTSSLSSLTQMDTSLFTPKEKILHEHLILEYERMGPSLRNHLFALLRKDKNDKIDIVQQTMIDLNRLKKRKKAKSVPPTTSNETKPVAAVPEEPPKIEPMTEMDTQEYQELVTRVKQKKQELDGTSVHDRGGSTTWTTLSSTDRLKVPSKRAIEKLLLRYEVPPFQIRPDVLMYHLVTPSSSSTEGPKETAYPNSKRGAFQVVPVYLSAHQQRMCDAYQKRYVELFNRRSQVGSGLILCQYNHVNGLNAVKAFHRMDHVRQMLQRELVDIRLKQLTQLDSSKKYWTDQEPAHAWYSHLTPEVVAQLRDIEPRSASSLLVKSQEAALRHVTANITTIEPVIYDYPISVQGPGNPNAAALQLHPPPPPMPTNSNQLGVPFTVRSTLKPIYPAETPKTVL